MARRNPHNGGEQLPLITPDSSWVRPRELPDLRRHKIITYDLETKDDGLAAGLAPSWPYRSGHVAGVAIGWEGGCGYFPVRHPETDCFDPEAVGRWVKDHNDAGVTFLCQGAHYDVGWTRAEWGVALKKVEDSIAMAVFLDENRLSYELTSLCEWQGIPGKDEDLLREAAAAYGWEGDQVKANLWKMPARYVGPYAEADGDRPARLREIMLPKLERDGVLDAYRLEMDLLPCVHEMRWRGVRVDVDAVDRTAEEIERRRDAALSDLSSHLGRTVTMEHVRSPRWLETEHASARIPVPRTEKGAPSFTKSWMRGHEHPLPRLVDLAGKLDEAANKFLRGFIQDFAHRGRLHASINQYRSDDGGTRSFRFSYDNPPLQQMPARDEELAALIRGVFLPEEGEMWGALDYSQQEYRLIVHYAALTRQPKAEMAAQQYIDDPKTDFHALVSEWTQLDRKPAKDSNFGKAFGAGVPKFASMINKTIAEAKAIYDQYDRLLPFVKELAGFCSKKASSRGWIKLIDGARCHFDLWEPAWRKDLSPEDRGVGYMTEAASKAWAARIAEKTGRRPRMKRAFTHKGMNRLIQGSAARQTKRAMLNAWREGYCPLLQMHDELDFSFAREEQGVRVAQIMREAIPLLVPMQVDAEYGPTWGRASKTKRKVDGKEILVYGATWAEALAAGGGKSPPAHTIHRRAGGRRRAGAARTN